MKIRCDRCGKEIDKQNAVRVIQSDAFRGSDESFWCNDCYNDFIKNTETTECAFKNVKPVIKQDFENNIKKFKERL